MLIQFWGGYQVVSKKVGRFIEDPTVRATRTPKSSDFSAATKEACLPIWNIHRGSVENYIKITTIFSRNL